MKGDGVSCQGNHGPMSTSHQTPDQTVPIFNWLLSTLRPQGLKIEGNGKAWRGQAGIRLMTETTVPQNGANCLHSAHRDPETAIHVIHKAWE